jgi:hypothetical protein
MGNTSNKSDEKKDMRKIPENCFLCKEKIEVNNGGFPNERYYNYVELSRVFGKDINEPFEYAICGNCNNVDINRNIVKIHKDRLKKKQYNKSHITDLDIDAMNEWDILNSYYHEETLYVCDMNSGHPIWTEYKGHRILKIEKDKIIINENGDEASYKFYRLYKARREFATTILGMDNYSTFYHISYDLMRKIVIYLRGEGDTNPGNDRWEKEQVGDIITFRRVGISIL